MTNQYKTLISLGLCILLGGLAVFLSGCSEETAVAPGDVKTSGETTIVEDFANAEAKSANIIRQDGSEIPAEIAEVMVGDAGVAFWPYTGTSLVESPVDPINVVFKGQADPVQIREALMSLDGDRTALGFPDLPPFNLPWTDAVGGDVQTTYLTDGGWEGCVIQLTLGEYTDLRVHLRLFATGLDDAAGGTWTLGGAHFEIMIPGTSEHQVLSWELAEMIVMADMARTGLLGAPPAPTGMINAAPSFRSIPNYIYNPLVNDPSGLGPMLLTTLGYPVEEQAGDFPLPSDGQGTVLYLAGAVPSAGDYYTNSVVIEYGQAVPRPVCNSGPYDWLYVTGPITFTTQVQVTADGRYQYMSAYDAVLSAVPINIETGEPIGMPFDAQVSGKQNGKHSPFDRKVKSFDRRLALQQGEPELFFEILQVGSQGRVGYKAFERCFDGD